MESNLNRSQYVILSIMKSQKAVDFMHSISCEEIRALEDRSKTTTIYRHLQRLIKEGFVILGAKIERANGYVLTNKALELLVNSNKEKKEESS